LTGKSKSRFQDLFVLGIVVASLSIGAYSQNSGTVFLVRHAEKASTARDAALSAQGVKRAECLARTLGGAGVQVIFTTRFFRTRETVRPLTTKLDLKALEYEDTAGLVEKLHSMSDKTVLVVGHSDTLPTIIEQLGAGRVDPIGDDEFDRLLVFHWTGSRSGSVVTLRYCDCQ
jgi:phosphohistidine phosphatase SixA